jgi:hypothetical protein
LGDQIKKNEMDEACSTCGERKGAFRVLVGKCEGKRPLVRTRHRWENNIKINIQEVVFGHGLDRCGSG